MGCEESEFIIYYGIWEVQFPTASTSRLTDLIKYFISPINFLQVWLLGNQRYQDPPFRYINRADNVSHLVRGRKLIGVMKFLIRSVKREVEAVGIWT